MHWFKRLFTCRRRYDELSESIREHLEEKIADLTDNGMTRDEAARAARREFGNVTLIEERSREVWHWPRLESVWTDVRYTLRGLWKSPGFTATAVLMLAFGIGATTAIFSIVEGVLLRPLPFPQSGRLVRISDILQGASPGGNGESGVTAPDILNYMRDTRSFESLGGFESSAYDLSGAGEATWIHGARMSAGVFPALGVQPLLGRFFTQQEDDQHQQVCLISYSLWQQRFHGDWSVLNRKILLGRKPYLIVGVMPRNFEFPLMPGRLNQSQLWAPMSFEDHELTSGASNWEFDMVGRLKPGISPEQAQSDLERVAQETMRNYPAFMASLRIRAAVHPLLEEVVAAARPLLHMLFLAVSVVLLIACANLAGLLMVRAIRRRRETSVRLALGARTGALLWQSLLESVVLSMSGGLLGLFLAAVALPAAKSFLPETLPRVSGIGVDWIVAAFALSLAIFTGTLCGLTPALAALHTNVNEALKEGGRTGSAGGGHTLLRSSLVVAEIAVSLILLAASGLFLRSFEKMREVNLGFRPDHTLTASYSLPKQYSTQTMVNAFNRELLLRLQQLPGTKAAGFISILPGSGHGGSQTFVVDGYTTPKGANMNSATPYHVYGDSFQALGIPLLRGRFFTPADQAGSQLVIIVNDKFAQHYWPRQDPLGKRLRFGTPQLQTPWLTVVGEVAAVKQGSPDEPTNEQFYTPPEQVRPDWGSLAAASDVFGNYGSIVLRTAIPPEQMENALRSTVSSIDSQLPLTQVQTMDQTVADSEGPRRFNTAVVSAFAGAALLLGVLGIYSVIAFSVTSRVQEMAIRMALGSQRSSIVRLVLRSAMMLALVGCALGLGGAAAASSLLRPFLFGVRPFDPLVMLLAGAVVFLLACAASIIPAHRAASVDPMQALRSE
jgi:putative ABC transport system permease protein